MQTQQRVIMDNNYNYRPKAQPRSAHRRSRHKDNRTNGSISSSDEDFHSDDNLRPYEEVKVAHHDKKLNGLGLTPEEHEMTPVDKNSRMRCAKTNHKTPQFYTYQDGSDDDESEQNLSISTKHASLNVNHQGSQCSISSNEMDNMHSVRSEVKSRLSDSDPDNRHHIHHNQIHHAATVPGVLPPCFTAPPPPPPIEDIPHHTTVPHCHNHSFAPSHRGNYSDAETCACRGHYADSSTALLHNHHNQRGHYSDNENPYHRGHFSDSEHYHPVRGHCPCSGEESDFEPHYLEHTESGNVFIPDGHARFPRTVPRSGSVPMSKPGELVSPQAMRPQGSNTVPTHFMNGDPNMSPERQAFLHPHMQMGCQRNMPSPHQTRQECGYYSKFGNTPHYVKKNLKRWRWRFTSFVLVIICVALLACTAYFAAMMFEKQDDKEVAHNSGVLNATVLKFSSPPQLVYLGLNNLNVQRIAPHTFWQTYFNQTDSKFVKFSFSIPGNARLAIYGRRNLPPSLAQFDFYQVLDGNTITAPSHTTRNRYTRETMEKRKETALVQYLDVGKWYLTVFNDMEEPQIIKFTTTLYESMGTDCQNDCNGRGECDNRGQCRCFPGYRGWDCSQSECPVLCSGNGRYERGVCRCHGGWKGQECEIPENECENPSCNGNGHCQNGRCVCNPGFQGPHCGIVACVDPTCSGNGVCHLGKCVCYKGFTGTDCSLPDKLNITHLCARDCSGHGQFDLEKGLCACDRFFTGLDCEREICRLECDHGHCQNQKCVCDEGWGGVLCEHLSCDPRCDGLKGSCDKGTCRCHKGWNGKHCTIDGCPNDCSGHGECRLYGNSGYKCTCHSGWKGAGCSIAMETKCDDNIDNDNDGLLDCMDPDCCSKSSCRQSPYCKTAPDPVDILLGKQAPSSTASFFEKMKFLIEGNSVQSQPSRNTFNQSQVSVIRGKVVTEDGSPLLGVRVYVKIQPLYGHTLSRKEGMFDILVNGGGSVTLEFTRQPFKTHSVSVSVPWNQVITMDTVVMDLKKTNKFQPDPSLCGVGHDHYTIRPVVLSTWQHTQLGACPEKSTIIPESQVLQESIQVPGTKVHLVYHSSETKGYKSVILIQMTPDVIPTNLALVHLKVSVQGTVMEKVFEADPGLKYSFSWNRLNAYKQKVYGIVPAKVHVGYKYVGCDYIFWEVRSTTMSGFDLTSSEIGGWNLDIHHTYNFQEGILHKGDGSNIYLKEKPQELINILGNGQPRTIDCAKCNGDATNNRLLAPVAMASGSDGSLYIWDLNFIRKLSPGRDDIVSIMQTSTISTSHKTYMTVSPVNGKLYISDYMNHRVVQIATMGAEKNLASNFKVVAGNGEECASGLLDRCGDGGLAIKARLVHPKGIAINKEGIIYIADNLNIRMISTDGIITTLIGSQGQPRSWEPMACGGSQPANKMRLQWPTALAIDPLDNTLHILDKNIILKLTKDNFLMTIAGRPINCPITNLNSVLSGVLSDKDEASSMATDVKLINPQSMAFGPHGEIYIVESDTHSINRVRVITSDGRIHHFAGTKSKCDCQKQNCQCYDPKETLAAQALFKELTSITVTPDGIVHIADAGNFRVFSIMSKLPQPDNYNQYQVFSPDTQEVYIFNNYGQHQHTVDFMTSQYMYNFTYNVNSYYGKLISVTDDVKNKIELKRDNELLVSEIVSPGNLKSTLEMNNLKKLQKFTSPSNFSALFTYKLSTGLLESKFLSNGQSYFYTYDDMGRLLETRQPTGEITSLVTDVNTTGSIVQINTDNSDAVVMATYGSVQSVMHGAAETQVTYLPDGAVIVVFPSNMSISIESGGHPILANQHRMHFKRKIIAPNKLIHKLEWRFYVRKRASSLHSRKIPRRLGNKMRVGATLSRQHVNSMPHDAMSGKTKALLINGENLLTVEYDRVTHTESITDKNMQDIIVISYDDSGLPVQFQPSGDHHAMNITYSQNGQITKWQYGEMWENRIYNDAGQLKERSRSGKAQFRFNYRYGKPLPTDIVMPSGKQYYLEYNNQGDLSKIRTPDLGNHFFNKVVSVGTQRYLYKVPSLDNAYSEEYDGNGKLLKIVYPSEQRRVTYRYNSYSQLTKILFGETEIDLTYDEDILKVSSAEVSSGAYSCQEGFAYSGSLVSGYDVTYPTDGRLISASFSYIYDNHFRISEIQANFGSKVNGTTTTFRYDANTGKLKMQNSLKFNWLLFNSERIFDQHLTISRKYDKYGRLENVNFKFNNKVKFSMKIGYDVLNRIHRWNTKFENQSDKRYLYMYDKDSNVIEILINGQSAWRFSYSNNGNINRVTENGSTRDLEYDVGDRITKSGYKRFKFDSDGFMAQRHDQHVSFNANGQLQYVSKQDKYRYFYFYDSAGRLVLMESNGGETMQYFYGDVSNPNRITHTYNYSSVGELTEYMYEPDGKLIAMKRGVNMYYIATDPMGSPLAVFNNQGEIVKRMVLSPLGSMKNDSNPSFQYSFGFQGGLYNPVTELVAFGNRIYDTDNGRWISPDYNSIVRNTQQILEDPMLTNNYHYRNPVNVHSKDEKFPILSTTEWLMMLGYDVRSLAPDVSYNGDIRPQSRGPQFTLLPMSSAFECTFLHDMDNLLTMSVVPKSKVSPLQIQKKLQLATISSILGDGVTLSYRDGKVVVGVIDNTPSWAKELALVLVNGSQVMDIKYNINGKDVHYLIKSDASKADEDLRQVGIHSTMVYYENGLNVTVKEVKHKGGFRLSRFPEKDVKLHGKHSVINIRYGTTYKHEKQRILKHAKDRAIQHAWKREKWILQNSLQSRYRWTKDEVTEILTLGTADGYEGHYIRSPTFYPELSDDCNNIRFIKEFR